jgi:hypothetical protein
MRRRLFWSLLAGFLFTTVVPGCAPHLTPAQETTYAAFAYCDGKDGRHDVQLERVQANGNWYIRGYAGLETMNRCMKDYWRDARAVAKASPASADPPLTEASVKELIRFAYLTNEPPSPGTFLRGAVFSNIPPQRSEFIAGTSVTFFYAINITRVGRAFDGQIVWLDPNGVAVRTINRPLDQSGVGGAWAWWTDSPPASDVVTLGTWSVELRLNGNLAGRYPFTVTAR